MKNNPKSLHDYQFLFETRPGIAQQTYRKQSESINRVVMFLGRDKEPKNVFQHDAVRYRDSMRQRYAKATVRIDLAVACRFFNWLIEQDVIENWFNPFKGVRVW